MNEREQLIKMFSDLYGYKPLAVNSLPRSGSDRRYFRLKSKEGNIVAVKNDDIVENRSFLGLTRHFSRIGLPVPAIIHENNEQCYFIDDLGDTSLYVWFGNKQRTGGFDEEAMVMYRKVLDNLVRFQVEGIRDLDPDLCYPYMSFDRQSMMWDLNYFKYMFLKLVSVRFDENELEKDFNSLCDFLLEADCSYFLYRDFQSANIMIQNSEPWFIDYQGGRTGAAQYDPASLLYDPKTSIPYEQRELLMEYYIEKFTSVSGTGSDGFRKYYHAYALIRMLQALGAFGYRGLFQQKPGFVQSILPGTGNAKFILESGKVGVELNELNRIFSSVSDIERSVSSRMSQDEESEDIFNSNPDK